MNPAELPGHLHTPAEAQAVAAELARQQLVLRPSVLVCDGDLMLVDGEECAGVVDLETLALAGARA